MKRKKQLCAIAMIGAGFLAGCDNGDDDNRLVGQLESDRIELTAEVSEPIVERAVTEGQAVSIGQVIIRQDTARVLSRIEEADAVLQQTRARHDELVRGPRREQVLAVQASVRGAEKELEFRETDLARAQEVFARNLAAAELRDRAQVARDTARANLENLEARLDELLTGTTAEELRQAEEAVRHAEAQVQSMQINLERHTTLAPADGVIDSLLFEPGERPGPGQPMAVLLSGNQVHARVYVPESLRVQVKPGTQARVYIDGLDRILSGRVRWVASESAFTPYFALTERDRGRLSFAAKIDIVDADERLPDGVPVEVELLLEDGSD
jgi:HlyD family secretion protein